MKRSKTSEKVILKNHKILTISDLFPGDLVAPEEYIKNIPKNILLSYAFLFLRDFDHFESNQNSEMFLKNYFSRYQSSIHIEWISVINHISNILNVDVTILYPLTNFKFFELVLTQSDFDHPVDTSYFEESNINMLKCYLALNKIFVDKETIASKALSEMSDNEKSLRISFMGSLMESDITKANPILSFLPQFIKCQHFFKFLAKSDMRDVLKKFLLLYQVKSIDHYMMRLYSIVVPDRKHYDHNGLLLVHTDSTRYPNMHKFIRMFILAETSNEKDFLAIRRKPLIELDESTYAVIYEKFVIDKLYTGLVFQIKEILDEHIKSQDLKKEKNYLSNIGNDFFEKELSYFYLNKILGKKCIKLSGYDILKLRGKKSKKSSEPDYYIRDFNKIYLFEVKNTLISSEIKYSFEFEKIEHYLKERFLYNKSGSGKIIVQLINNIKLIISNDCDFDNFNAKDIKYIYPIAILPEETYNSYGMNCLANRWLEDELSNSDIILTSKLRIQPLVLVTIDTLIYLSYYDQKGLVKFKDLVDTYINDYVNSTKLDRQRISFAKFAFGYLQYHRFPIVPFDYVKMNDEGLFSMDFTA